MPPMQWLFDIVVEQMLEAGFINDWARARIWQIGSQDVPSSVFTRVELQRTEFSNRVTVDLLNDRLIIQDDGYYLIEGYVTLLFLADQKRLHAALLVNSAFSTYGVQNVSRVGTENPAVFTGTVRHLHTGDAIELAVFHDHGVARITQAQDYATWLACHRLS